jgi:hypothetical protein
MRVDVEKALLLPWESILWCVLCAVRRGASFAQLPF